MKSTNHSHRHGRVRSLHGVRRSLSSLSPLSPLSPRRFSKTAVSLGLSLGLATAGLGAGVLAPSASAQIHEICTASEGWTPDHKITHGHQDMTVLSENGLEPALIDDSSGESLSYGSGRSVVEVSNDQHVKLGKLGIEGLPDEGWYLPQTQLPNVPWLGFSTMYLGDHLVEGESVSMNLNLKQGPGRMIGWLPEDFGNNKIVLDSEDSNDAWPIPYNTHVHTGFVFEKAGVYEVGFEFGLPRGGTQTLDIMFLVGDYDCADRGSTSTGANSGSKSKGNNNKPKTFGDHLTAMEKEITQTEKAISGIENSVRKLVSPFTKKDDKNAAKPNAAGKPGAPGAPGASNSGNKPAPAKPGQPGGGNSDTNKPAPAGGGPKPAPVAPKSGGAAPAPAPSGGGASGSLVPAKTPAPAPAPAPAPGGGSGTGSAPGLEAAPLEGADGENLEAVDGQGNAFASADGAAQRGATSANYKPTSSSMSFFSGLILGLGVFAFALGIGIYVVMWQRSRNK